MWIPLSLQFWVGNFLLFEEYMVSYAKKITTLTCVLSSLMLVDIYHNNTEISYCGETLLALLEFNYERAKCNTDIWLISLLTTGALLNFDKLIGFLNNFSQLMGY